MMFFLLFSMTLFLKKKLDMLSYITGEDQRKFMDI